MSLLELGHESWTSFVTLSYSRDNMSTTCSRNGEMGNLSKGPDNDMFGSLEERSNHEPVEHAHHKTIESRYGGTLRMSVVILITSILTWTLARATSHLPPIAVHRSSSSQKLEDCGSSVAEAKAKGCIFDPLTVYWMPSTCSQAYTSEFLEYGRQTNSLSWRYWGAPNDTDPLQDLATLEAEAEYYTTNSEHLAHCTFMLLRLAESAKSGKRVDTMTSDLKHSKHCALMLLEASKSSPQWDEIRTIGRVRLGAC